MHLPPRHGDQVRIGVALEVPAPYGPALRAARARLGDPLAHAIPPHVTLVPPTVVEAAELPVVVDHLAEVAGRYAPFVVQLAGTGTFRPVTPVVFVNVVQGGDRCEELQRAARTGPLAQELRFPYHPHVTVAHDLPGAALDEAERDLAGFAATYAQGSMRLYEHGDDGVWRTVARLPLVGSTVVPAAAR
ncbi:2'-5' RNA ligase family protein [Georgenia sp. TF02-10]|uniref:2'-5' RNA ligase family protein n=1 Tax=Georgenia sp. TF02-10 TaxID=2917725 RepID=UPI001FA6BEB4|nr:2'-5' RNA ligase family protein [Georgenia sp. TF02-10]UNX54204.1 2'-5' RNA ligase family protein [Georgenia sp. TF02-10]